jgi:hypothetical protein
MKKYFLLFALILIFSVSGCGKKSENPTTPEQNDADETAETSDEDADTDSYSDSEEGDEDSEQNDAGETAETADNEQNEADVEEDSDMTPDSEQSDDDAETLEQPDGDMPECSPESATPCKDTTSGLIWSSKYYGNFENSMDYCMDLDEGGFDNWEIPTIKQLRSLIKNCPGTELSGECETEVDPNSSYGTPFNYSIENCSSCALDQTGKYSKFGDTETLWTISFPSNTLFNLLVDFTDAGIEEMDCPTFDTPLRCDAVYYHVRCVR